MCLDIYIATKTKTCTFIGDIMGLTIFQQKIHLLQSNNLTEKQEKKIKIKIKVHKEIYSHL